VNGACLESFVYEFHQSEESGVVSSYSSSTKMLTFYTERTDLASVETSLTVFRDNGDLLQTATFNYSVTVQE
jgi:hypothetical protein